MPVLDAADLERLTREILRAAGTPADEAQLVAEALVGANLAGHDSHGVLQLPIYVDRIRTGHIVPGAPITVERETPVTARVNGHWGFGFVVTRRAAELAIAKAQRHGLAAVTVYRQGHIGRLAPYATLAAREGLAAILFTDSGRGPKSVAPFGGRAPRLGTNPLCIAVPSDEPWPVFIDMATCAVAGNKLLVAQRRGTPIPPGWLIDEAGRPATDPFLYPARGALLPLGGDQGHKGYGLGFMGEVFASILPTLGFGHDPTGRHQDGCFYLCWRIDAFMPLEEFRREVSAFIAYVKSAPPAPGFDEVLYPGEWEARMTARRLREGVEVETATWQALEALAAEYGVPDVPRPR